MFCHEKKSSDDVYLEFYEVESEKNKQVMVDKGFVLTDEKRFEIVDA